MTATRATPRIARKQLALRVQLRPHLGSALRPKKVVEWKSPIGVSRRQFGGAPRSAVNLWEPTELARTCARSLRSSGRVAQGHVPIVARVLFSRYRPIRKSRVLSLLAY